MLFNNIMSCKNCSNSRCICWRTSYSLFFQCLYKTCFRKMCRRLCKMLYIQKLFKFKFISYLKLSYNSIRTYLFFIIIISINTHKSVKYYFWTGHSKDIISCTELNWSSLIICIFHSAGNKSLPYKLIQSEKLSWQRFFNHCRSKIHICRSYSLVCILNIIVICLCNNIFWNIFRSVAFIYKLSCSCICLGSYSGWVCTQICYKSNCSLTLHFHAFI